MIKPYYTVADLAKMHNVTTKGMREMIKRMNIDYTYINDRLIIYLSDIQLQQPTFYASLLLCARENARINQAVAIEVNSESALDDKIEDYLDTPGKMKK